MLNSFALESVKLCQLIFTRTQDEAWQGWFQDEVPALSDAVQNKVTESSPHQMKASNVRTERGFGGALHLLLGIYII